MLSDVPCVFSLANELLYADFDRAVIGMAAEYTGVTGMRRQMRVNKRGGAGLVFGRHRVPRHNDAIAIFDP